MRKSSIERLHRIYSGMRQRCYNKKAKAYEYYGGRGITICEEWLNDREKFISWALSHGYKNTLSIDRKDVNGNYEPSNCRWATAKQQIMNRRPSSEWKRRTTEKVVESKETEILLMEEEFLLENRLLSWIKILRKAKHRDYIVITGECNEGLLYCDEYIIDLDNTKFCIIEQIARNMDAYKIVEKENYTEIVCRYSTYSNLEELNKIDRRKYTVPMEKRNENHR